MHIFIRFYSMNCYRTLGVYMYYNKYNESMGEH